MITLSGKENFPIFGEMRKEELIDQELGRIVIQENHRATRIIFRATPDGVTITLPRYIPFKEGVNQLENFREKLLAARQELVKPRLDFGFRLVTELFDFSIIKGEADRFLVRSAPGQLTIVAPPGTGFEEHGVQQWLLKAMEQGLKKSAAEWLPSRIRELSARYGLPFRSVRITSSKGRWGSCSSGKNINLSCYLLLVPSRLVDYVILHELCHTVEMNHGEKFWKLLDGCTGNKARELRKELKAYRPAF